ncbi:MAG: hypothetical protein IT481_08550 [Gammaproteobacteria bacterium]|nr:hypothetical protein [Gammaproteobacteria bacterium]
MSSVFSKPERPAALAVPPAVTPAAPMPSPDSMQVADAQRRQVLEARNRRGRASTILGGSPSASPGGAGFDSYDQRPLG